MNFLNKREANIMGLFLIFMILNDFLSTKKDLLKVHFFMVLGGVYIEFF
jgi:hypothetical protein